MPVYTITSPKSSERLTVSALNQQCKQLLESNFQRIQVEGELSNLACPSSGHIYFSLKDTQAQIRCAFFKGKAKSLDFKPENGMQVTATATVSLYEPRGDYQLIVERLEESGLGQLQRAYEKLKQTLSAKGYFELAHKKPLPSLPKCIGLITSPSGAAIHDMLTTLKRRAPFIPVIIYPCEVQGERAATMIVNAIHTANQRNECDVLLLARGGGSLEDLWCFNEKRVAEAVFTSQLPIVTGVGHETDTTIVDYICDQRAATPTAAAEHASPSCQLLNAQLQQLTIALKQGIQRTLEQSALSFNYLKNRLRTPSLLIQKHAQRLDNIELTLAHQVSRRIQSEKILLQRLQTSLVGYNPYKQLDNHSKQLVQRKQRLYQAVNKILIKNKQHFIRLGASLNVVSPLATLERGYAIALNEQNQVIFNDEQLTIGETLHVRLRHHRLVCQLKGISDENNNN